jgi:hypothetical protein
LTKKLAGSVNTTKVPLAMRLLSGTFAGVAC